mgnify:FL=1
MMHWIFNSQSRVIGAALVLALVGWSAPGFAQDAKKKANNEENNWVKVCDKAPVPEKGKDGKVVKAEKEVCITRYQQIDGNTGINLVTVGLQQVKGQDAPHLMIMVPLGMVLKAGVGVVVLNADEWKTLLKKEKLDEKKLKQMLLGFEHCIFEGCTARAQVKPEVVDSLKKGAGMLVMSVDIQGRPASFIVSLKGFTKAMDGKPIDNKVFAQMRQQAMAQIRERQKQAYQQYMAKQKKEGGKKK